MTPTPTWSTRALLISLIPIISLTRLRLPSDARNCPPDDATFPNVWTSGPEGQETLSSLLASWEREIKGFPASSLSPTPISINSTLEGATLQGAEKDIQALRETPPHSPDADALAARLDEALGFLRANLGLMRQSLRDSQAMAGDEYRIGIADSVTTASLVIAENETAVRRLAIDIAVLKEAKGRSVLFDLNADTGMRHRQEPRSLGLGATAGLEAARARLQETVERSGRTLETLSDSSSTVTGSGEELREQSAALTTTRSLLTKYGRREWTDKLLIFIALAFFLACAFYVVQKRLI